MSLPERQVLFAMAPNRVPLEICIEDRRPTGGARAVGARTQAVEGVVHPVQDRRRAGQLGLVALVHEGRVAVPTWRSVPPVAGAGIARTR